VDKKANICVCNKVTAVLGNMIIFIVRQSRAIDKPKISLCVVSIYTTFFWILMKNSLVIFSSHVIVSLIFRANSTEQQPSQIHPRSKAQLPFCINDSLALAHKHYNQKKIKQIRFLFKHRENCLLKKTNLVKKFQSQPNIYRNWNCEECGL
jgi:chromate transport protein ChrA